MPFDQTDLNETVDAIRTRLSNGESVVGLLEEIVSLVLDREAWWQAQLDGLQSEQQEMASAQQAIMKSMVMLARGHDRATRKRQMLEKSVAGLMTMAKSRGITTTAVHPKMAEQGLTLEQEARRGLLAKAALKLFGPGGGKRVVYEKSLATRLLMDGRINAAQHDLWKRTNRLPDGIVL